jgi:uncharacterized protein YdgA (DUF945 family)
MKKLVVAVVILAVVLLVAPFGIGRLAEKRLNAGLDKLVEQAPYLVIAERKWTGGWFKSEQLVTIEMNDSFAKAVGGKALGEILAKESAEADAALDAEGTDQAAADAVEADAAPTESEAGAEDTAESATGEDAATDESAEENAEDSADDGAEASKPFRFTVRNEVLHGPVLGLSGFGLARVDTHLDLDEETRAKIREIFGPKPAMEVRTRVGFLGGGTTTFSSEGRTIKPKDEDTEISYDTFKMSVGVSRKADSYDVDGKWPTLTVKDGGSEVFVMNDLTLDGDGERVFGELYDGEFAFKVKQIKVTDKDKGTAFGIDDIHYIVDSRTKDGFVTIGAKFGSGKVTSNELAATGIDIKEIHYDFSMRKLHAESLEKLAKAMRDMYATAAKSEPGTEDAMFAPFKEHGLELLKHDPEFSLDRIGLVTAEGEGVIKGTVKFVGVTPEDLAAPGGMALIGKLDADITIEAAQKLVEKFPNGATMAGAAVDGGYAKREGDKLVCRITFKQGQLTVNGKPQAIPGLGGPPPGAMEQEMPADGEMPPEE